MSVDVSTGYCIALQATADDCGAQIIKRVCTCCYSDSETGNVEVFLSSLKVLLDISKRSPTKLREHRVACAG